jgi:quercetin dioxygenase-like cupin family protein
MIKNISFSMAIDKPKGWGKERQIINQVVLPDETFPKGYSGKLLVYEKAGAVSSMHFHTVKHETFYVLTGTFAFYYYNPENADVLKRVLWPGDVVEIPPCNPHQLVCEETGIIIEFASTDYAWDNYRVGKGDSQRPKLIKISEMKPLPKYDREFIPTKVL